MATLKDLLVSGPARVIGNITGNKFVKEGGTASQFLKADGSVDSNAYSTTSHNHSGVYKPVQTAVSDPSASATTSTTFIDSISQNANGVITATKKTLPSYSASNHTHTTTIATSTGTNQITLAFGTKYAITAGGTSYVFTMPSLGTTATTAAAGNHTHSGYLTSSSSLNAANLTGTIPSDCYSDSNDFGTVLVDTPGGTAEKVGIVNFPYALKTGNCFILYLKNDNTVANAKLNVRRTGAKSVYLDGSAVTADNWKAGTYLFYYDGVNYHTSSKSPFRDMNTTYGIATGDSNGQIKVTPSDGSAYNVSVKGLGSAAYTASSAYAAASHSHNYLPLAGGVMSGTITRSYNSASEEPMIKLASANQDSTIWRAVDKDTDNYGFSLVYNGVGTGNNNDLVLFADAQGSSTKKEAYRVHQDGQVVFSTTPTVNSTAVSLNGHTHTTTIAASTGTNQITLAFGAKYAITAGGTSYVFTMPSNPNTNTTYTIATGDSNGQIKVTPSSGSAYNVSVKGLGSAAYTASTAYATSGHTHSTSIATSTGTNQITLAFGAKYAITAGGTSYVFTMPANPNTDSVVEQDDLTSSTKWHYPLLSSSYSSNALDGISGGNTDAVGFSNKFAVNPGDGEIYAAGFIQSESGFKVTGQSGFLMADGGVNGNSYSLSNHTHSGYAASSHSHGSITSDGAISSGTALANGDAIVFSDSSDSSKLKKSTITFDGSTTSKYLSQKGTWESIPTSLTPTSHTHGNIQNGGTLQTNDITIASGDKLVVTDSSDSSKIARTSISFDGSTTTKFLSQKGTWETPSGGGSTVVGKTVELSTSNQALITVNGSNSGHVKLPDYCPWVAIPANSLNKSGGTIPIFRADTPEVMVNSNAGSFSDIQNVNGVHTMFLFPDVGKSSTLFALPVAMDGHGHLFVLISEALATDVFLNCGMDIDAGALRGK